MDEKPLFSVITVTRDNLAGLRKTANSVNEQNFPGYEWIVIDGASSDGTPAFLANTNARWTSEPDAGIYDAMNKGIAAARGHYLLFMNAGDALAGPHRLGDVAEKINRAAVKPGFVYGDCYVDVKGTPQIKRARSHEKMAWGMFASHQAMFYRASDLRGLRFDTRYQVAADYDFTCRFLQRKPPTLYVDLPLSVFESGGLSERKRAIGHAEERQIRAELNLCSPVTSAFISARHLGSAFLQAVAPAMFLRLRNLEGAGPSPE